MACLGGGVSLRPYHEVLGISLRPLNAQAMFLGPIFRVELVSIARLNRYFFLRFLYGIIILLVMWVACEEIADLYSYNQSGSNIQRYSRAAVAFFGSYVGLQMLAILALGPAIAVGTIATERERRTIEYLFTTDLRNHEIILGKACRTTCSIGPVSTGWLTDPVYLSIARWRSGESTCSLFPLCR